MSSSRKKILIASIGTRGDVQPYAALARPLADLGADVLISCPEGFYDMIEAAGATSRPLPVNYQELLQREDIRAALFSLKGKIQAARENIDLQRKVALALWNTCLEERPDLILFNLKATVATLAARRLGVPALPTCLQPVTAVTSEFPVPLFGIPPLGPYLNRKSYGVLRWLMKAGLGPILKPLKQEAADVYGAADALIDGHDPDGGTPLSLQGFSAALVPRPGDWPEHAWQSGYWFTEPDPAYTPPDDLEHFLKAGEPPIYIGFGSMPSRDPETLTRLALEALGKVSSRAILATGWGGLSLSALPPDMTDRVFVLGKAPHSWLFPRCAAVVHHGGAGTTHEALRWGRPSLVCPVFGDQPFWGARVAAIGAGPDPIPQKRLTADHLAAAMAQLSDPSLKAGAGKAAAIMAREPGARGTAERLISLIG
jgi:sterol 3beta-glucosyltransferase